MKIVQNVQKWLINVSKEPNARKSQLILEQTWNTFQFGVNLLLVFAAIRKVKNTLNSKSIPTQDLLQARSSIKFGEFCMG